MLLFLMLVFFKVAGQQRTQLLDLYGDGGFDFYLIRFAQN